MKTEKPIHAFVPPSWNSSPLHRCWICRIRCKFRSQGHCNRNFIYVFSILNKLSSSALQPFDGSRPAQLSLSILSRTVLRSVVANNTSKPQPGGETIHYQINPFIKFVKDHVADRVQDNSKKGLSLKIYNLFIKVITCDVDSSDSAITGNRCFKTDGAHKMIKWTQIIRQKNWRKF